MVSMCNFAILNKYDKRDHRIDGFPASGRGGIVLMSRNWGKCLIRKDDIYEGRNKA